MRKESLPRARRAERGRPQRTSIGVVRELGEGPVGVGGHDEEEGASARPCGNGSSADCSYRALREGNHGLKTVPGGLSITEMRPAKVTA